MFFAPPKVKSLSRYAEFGIYLGPRYFMMMLGAAFLIHAGIIAIYSLLPHEEVMRIPVRVLNIKLGSGIGEDSLHAPEILPAITPDMPDPAASLANQKEVRQELKAAPIVSRNEKTAENMLDKALSGDAGKADKPGRAARAAQEKSDQIFGHLSAEETLAVPKRYVRSAPASGNLAAEGKNKASGAGSRNGNAVTGKESEEIVQRYEQAISLWMGQHKIYPEAARRSGIEGSAVIRVRINRKGHIVYNRIEQSSGNAVIDEAVVAMVRSSDPVPGIPENYPTGEEFEFLIPVSFRLQ